LNYSNPLNKSTTGGSALPATIYQITNQIDGKSYIGFDSKYPNRIEDHHYCQGTSKSYLHRAIKKYGWENFTHKMLYIGEDVKHALKVIEPFFIKYLQTKVPNGYNITDGGEGTLGIKRSKIWKRKQSLAQSGKKQSKETKLKRSLSLKGHPNWNKGGYHFKGYTPWNKGKQGLQSHTEEWKRNHSKLMKGRIPWNKR